MTQTLDICFMKKIIIHRLLRVYFFEVFIDSDILVIDNHTHNYSVLEDILNLIQNLLLFIPMTLKRSF